MVVYMKMKMQQQTIHQAFTASAETLYFFPNEGQHNVQNVAKQSSAPNNAALT